MKHQPLCRCFVFVLLALGTIGCRTSGPSVVNPNILLITIDTLRADHLGSYGYTTASTPSLDALARRGLRFDRAVTVTPLTLPAHVSLMTGTYPGYHGIRDNAGGALAETQTTLAEVLRGRGYRTAGFVASFVLDHRWGLDKGFDRYSDDVERPKPPSDVGLDTVQRPGHEVVDDATAWMDEDKDRPFFAWVHLYEPHTPYDAPERLRARFPPTTVGAYDAEIATADEQVGRLIDRLSSEGRLGRTIVVALGDHGESLGDHQEQEHGFFIYDATVRIPLIVAGPGIPSREIRNQVRIIDVMPTLLELAGIEIPTAVQGTSLVPMARGSDAQLSALAETWYPRRHFGWSELTAIRDDRYTFIAAPRRELYDRHADPGETHNLAATNPERANSLERALSELIRHTSSDAKPPTERRVDVRTAERLRSLGYVGGRVTVANGNRPLADPKDKITVYNLLKQAADTSAQGRLDDAIATVRRALDSDSEMVEGYTMLGDFLRKTNHADEALWAFQRALTLDPHSTKSAWNVAEIWTQRREFGKAEAALKQVIMEAADRPAFLTKLAECQIELTRYDEAARNLREALQERPDQPVAHYDLALIHEARRESAQAMSEYEAELKHNPTMDRAHFNLGKLLTASGRRSEAAARFQAAVDANPEFSGGYLYLAKARLDEGDLPRAEAAARKGLSLNPDRQIAPLGHYVLADVYNRLGKPQDSAREAAIGRKLERSR